jgi:hypothetical protein
MAPVYTVISYFIHTCWQSTDGTEAEKRSFINPYNTGSILQEPGKRETYHAFCIIAVHEEDDNRSIRVHDPSTQEYVDL